MKKINKLLLHKEIDWFLTKIRDKSQSDILISKFATPHLFEMVSFFDTFKASEKQFENYIQSLDISKPLRNLLKKIYSLGPIPHELNGYIKFYRVRAFSTNQDVRLVIYNEKEEVLDKKISFMKQDVQRHNKHTQFITLQEYIDKIFDIETHLNVTMHQENDEGDLDNRKLYIGNNYDIEYTNKIHKTLYKKPENIFGIFGKDLDISTIYNCQLVYNVNEYIKLVQTYINRCINLNDGLIDKTRFEMSISSYNYLTSLYEIYSKNQKPLDKQYLDIFNDKIIEITKYLKKINKLFTGNFD